MGQGKLRFFVEDSGIGIEASKLTAVFQAFYQVDLSEEREYGGNGLEAVEMVKESADLALVLMDIKMPHSKQVANAICLSHLTLLSCCVWLGNYFVYLFGDLFHLFGLRKITPERVPCSVSLA